MITQNSWDLEGPLAIDESAKETMSSFFLSTSPPYTVIRSYGQFLRKRQQYYAQLYNALVDFVASDPEKVDINTFLLEKTISPNSIICACDGFFRIEDILVGVKEYFNTDEETAEGDAIISGIGPDGNVINFTSQEILFDMNVVASEVEYIASLLDTAQLQSDDSGLVLLNLSDACVGLNLDNIQDFVSSTKQCLSSIQTGSDLITFIKQVMYNVNDTTQLTECFNQPLMPNGNFATSNPVKAYFNDGYFEDDLSRPFDFIIKAVERVGDLALKALNWIVKPVANLIKTGIKAVETAVTGTICNINKAPSVDSFGIGNSFIRLRLPIETIPDLSFVTEWGPTCQDFVDWFNTSVPSGGCRRYSLPFADLVLFKQHDGQYSYLCMDIHLTAHSYSIGWPRSMDVHFPNSIWDVWNYLNDHLSLSTSDMVYPSSEFSEANYRKVYNNISSSRSLLCYWTQLYTYKSGYNFQTFGSALFDGVNDVQYMLSQPLYMGIGVEEDGVWASSHSFDFLKQYTLDSSYSPSRMYDPDTGTHNQFTFNAASFGGNGISSSYWIPVEVSKAGRDKHLCQFFEFIMVALAYSDTNHIYIPYLNSYNWNNTAVSLTSTEDNINALKDMATTIVAATAVVVATVVIVKRVLPKFIHYVTYKSAEYKGAQLEYIGLVSRGEALPSDTMKLRRAGKVSRWLGKLLPGLAGYAASGLINGVSTGAADAVTAFSNVPGLLTSLVSGSSSSSDKIDELISKVDQILAIL